jgi:cysteine desulfurase/selenocysteine lyase
MALDVTAVKKDFPIFDHDVRGKRLVFLDSAASSQKPRAVLDAMDDYYETTHANVHRGVYAIAEEATRLYEQARRRVGALVGVSDPAEVIFTKNVTESFNLISYSWGRANLGPGDVVVLSLMEHHANLVPWLQLKQERDIELRYLGLTADGRLDSSGLEAAVEGAKLVSIPACSNVLGTLTPVRQLADAAHAAGALLAVDGAQLVPHVPTDLGALGADFFGFTGHKMLGPTGIGVLCARRELLEAMPPFLGGGEMISDVRTDGFTPTEIPWKFEAGTPPIAEAIGLAAAVEYLERLGMQTVRDHEKALSQYAIDSLTERFGPDITIHGPLDAESRGGLVSFAFKDIHPHDLSQVLDESGVCVRAGHHCAKPLMRHLGLSATARASWSVYNDESDIDALGDALVVADRLFS